jgi:hypothetical protein
MGGAHDMRCGLNILAMNFENPKFRAFAVSAIALRDERHALGFQVQIDGVEVASEDCRLALTHGLSAPQSSCRS